MKSCLFFFLLFNPSSPKYVPNHFWLHSKQFSLLKFYSRCRSAWKQLRTQVLDWSVSYRPHSLLFHILSCPISPQSLQHALLEAAVSCRPALSPGDIQQRTKYHRLPSGGRGLVALKVFVWRYGSFTHSMCNVHMSMQLTHISVFIHCFVFVSPISRGGGD